jgi:pilus assembly protein CpaF
MSRKNHGRNAANISPQVLSVSDRTSKQAGEKSHTVSMTGNQSLFFSSSEAAREFSSVLHEVQEYISSKYATLITDGGTEEVKAQVKRYITKYIQDYRIAVSGMTQMQLVDALYTEMAEFSFLTKYIFGVGIEEIDINAWNDIEVQYSNGSAVKLDEHFESPEHGINVVRRMLHVSGMVLDNASPAILGHLSKNIRIAVLKTPLVDEDVGVAASIRIVNPQSMISPISSASIKLVSAFLTGTTILSKCLISKA